MDYIYSNSTNDQNSSRHSASTPVTQPADLKKQASELKQRNKPFAASRDVPAFGKTVMPNLPNHFLKKPASKKRQQATGHRLRNASNPKSAARSPLDGSHESPKDTSQRLVSPHFPPNGGDRPSASPRPRDPELVPVLAPLSVTVLLPVSFSLMSALLGAPFLATLAVISVSSAFATALGEPAALAPSHAAGGGGGHCSGVNRFQRGRESVPSRLENWQRAFFRGVRKFKTL